ncbi:hypothetical protein PGIGA_G00130280 [Pangasianodon gigas]|uniref:Uncharacterized protein n=1 Tax=Pangasianodon gigas TaxID=30993 RepID=A0ACC5XIC3_PANGG|nr:hypothetical protein [Pangasianodon gigas]
MLIGCGFPASHCLILIYFPAFISAVSYLIYRLSSEQKNTFCKNPDDSSVAHLETIISPSGQNLLVSGWFGWFGRALFCGFSSVLPYVPALHCMKLPLVRATDIEELCKEKHGAAWREHCRRVPYKLLPYIY